MSTVGTDEAEQLFQRVRASIDELLDAWQEFNDRDTGYVISKERKQPALAPLLAVLGLSSHAFAIGARARPLLDEQAVFAAPLVRLMFESAVTAVWVGEHENTWQGFVNESNRNHRNVNAALPAVIPGADFSDLDVDVDLDKTHNQQAKYFEQCCNDFENGKQLYAHYRFMSQMCHPNSKLIDPYLTVDPYGTMRAFHPDPNPDMSPDQVLVWLAGMSLQFAMSAVATSARTDPKFDVLENARQIAASTLGISIDLTLTRAAKARV